MLWDRETPYKRYLINHGFSCEVIAPGAFAVPSFPAKVCRLLIVPAGFGNSLYSNILSGLRASSMSIKDFVKGGGTLLVSGAMSEEDAYDWLPIKLRYVTRRKRVKVGVITAHEAAMMIVKRDECFCDGYFDDVGAGCVILLAEKGNEDEEERAILILSEYGAGKIIATTIHEYPSEEFIAYCVRARGC